MKKIFTPHSLFWITATLILLDGFFIQDPESVADVNIHDTYYVIAHGLFAQIFAFIFFTIGLGYWLFLKANRKLHQTLTLIHIIGTVGITWIYLIVISGLSLFKLSLLELTNSFIVVAFLIAILVQPIYIVNLLIGVIKPRARR